MAQRKTVKQQKRNEVAQRRNYIVVSIIVVAVLLILWAGWWLVFKRNVYSPDKSQVKNGVQSVLNDASFSGRVVYNKLIDAGCDNGNSVGLATYVHCDFLAQKYFMNSGDLRISLQEADTVLAKAGWQRKTSPQDYEDVLSGRRQTQIEYSKNGQTLALVFYKNTAWSDVDIKKLLNDGQISSFKDDEFVYGVRAMAGYWSCRADSLFEICPLPPAR